MVSCFLCGRAFCVRVVRMTPHSVAVGLTVCLLFMKLAVSVAVSVLIGQPGYTKTTT